MINEEKSLFSNIVEQTARIRWHDLQRFFAQGRVLQVASQLELPKVAHSIAQDSVASVEHLLESEQITTITDQQAKQWYQQNVELWAVVVAPYVLVQATEMQANDDNNHR